MVKILHKNASFLLKISKIFLGRGKAPSSVRTPYPSAPHFQVLDLPLPATGARSIHQNLILLLVGLPVANPVHFVDFGQCHTVLTCSSSDVTLNGFDPEWLYQHRLRGGGAGAQQRSACRRLTILAHSSVCQDRKFHHHHHHRHRKNVWPWIRLPA